MLVGRPGVATLCEAVYVMFEGQGAVERYEIAEEIVKWVRSKARGEQPGPRSSPFDKEQHFREAWARMTARVIIDLIMAASERSSDDWPPPGADRTVLLREIARGALWHMPNADQEARELVRVMTLERLKQPHAGDDPLPEKQ
jgi:hypothetical protein